MRYIKVLLILMLFVVLGFVASAADTYVDDDAAGGWYDATHVHTVQEGIDNASAGDTVYIWDGLYVENVAINKCITLVGNGTSSCIDACGSDDNIAVTSANYVNISYLLINNSGQIGGVTDDSGISLLDCDHTNISHCNFTDNLYGIKAIWCNYTNVWYNNFDSNTDAGFMQDEGGSNITFSNNYLINLADFGNFEAYETTNITCINNTFVNGVFETDDADAFYIDNCYGNVLLERNTIDVEYVGVNLGSGCNGCFTVHNNSIRGEVYGIYTTVDHWINITDNVIYDTNVYDGIQIAGIEGNVSIQNNTIYNISRDGIYCYAYYDIFIKNNTIYNTGTASTDIGIYLRTLLEFGYGNAYVYDNKINDTAGNGIEVRNEFRNLYVNNNTLLENTNAAFYLDATNNVTIDNCTVDGCKYYLYGEYENTTITNCSFDGATSWESYSWNIRNLNFSHNLVNLSAGGMYFMTKDNGSFYDNDFYSTVGGDLITGMGNLTISNNYFNGSYYIHYADVAPYGADVTIINNIFNGNNISTDGIYLYNGGGVGAWGFRNFVIANNTIRDVTTEGILLVGDGTWTDINNLTIYNNTIINAETGFHIANEVRDFTFYNNNISQCDYDLHLYDSTNFTMYNNYFSGPNHFENYQWIYDDTWNISKTLGTSIVGGPYLGGNYWINYTGEDLDGDCLGDTLIPFNDSILNSDYHPLVIPSDFVCDFHWSPIYPESGETVNFYDDSTGTPISWKWEWGDDSDDSTVKNPTHAFEQSGTYTVKLTVSDGTRYSTRIKLIHVGRPDVFIPELQPPLYAGFTVPEMYHLMHVDQLYSSDAEIVIMYIDSGTTQRMYKNTDLSKIQALFHPSTIDPWDDYGHGTFVGYEIQYIVQEKLPKTKVISYRIFGEGPYTESDVFIDALEQAKHIKPDILSISAGTIGNPSDIFCRKVSELRSMGVIVICAAGNYGPASSSIISPGCGDSALAIGGEDPQWHYNEDIRRQRIEDLRDDRICIWSSRGPVPDVSQKPDVAAPGESIIGPWCNAEVVKSGTSMSAPLVSGGAAVVLANNKGIVDFNRILYFWWGGLVPNSFENALKESCYHKDNANNWGAGIPQFDDLNGAFFWKMLFWAVLPFIIIGLVIVGYLIYRRKDESGSKRKNKPKHAITKVFYNA